MTRITRFALFTAIAIGLVGSLSLASERYFSPELRAVGWHLRHGNSVEVQGLRFGVPLLYHAEVDQSGEGVSLARDPGTLIGHWGSDKLRFGQMSFVFHDPTLTKLEPKMIRRLYSELAIEEGVVHTHKRDVSMAGRQGSCLEYSVTFHGEVRFGTEFRIVCTFGSETVALFQGMEPAVPDFYRVMESAQLLERKN